MGKQSQSKHTSGEWKIIRKKSGARGEKISIGVIDYWTLSPEGERDWMICDMRQSLIKKGYDPSPEANAKLIAAAPAMFEALKGICSYGSMKERDRVVLDQLIEQGREAIKKATF